jgi:hypothetical protein
MFRGGLRPAFPCAILYICAYAQELNEALAPKVAAFFASQVVLSRSPLYAYRLPLAAFSQQGSTTHGNQ